MWDGARLLHVPTELDALQAWQLLGAPPPRVVLQRTPSTQLPLVRGAPVLQLSRRAPDGRLVARAAARRRVRSRAAVAPVASCAPRRPRRPLTPPDAGPPLQGGRRGGLGPREAPRLGATKFRLAPSAAQATAGFARGEAAGVPRTARERCYRDPSHKPELVVALGPFHALAGFRSVTETAAWLARLEANGAPALTELGALLARSTDAAALRAALTWAFELSEHRRRQVVEELGAAARSAPASDPLGRAARWVALLAERHPADPGVVGAALLEQRSLGPGGALFLPAGSLHAYLAGLALEVMASSDNVLRGGLTTKHVDVPELLGVFEFDAPAPLPIAPSPPFRRSNPA